MTFPKNFRNHLYLFDILTEWFDYVVFKHPVFFISTLYRNKVSTVGQKFDQFIDYSLTSLSSPGNKKKQAGAELGQAQLPIGIGLYCD